MHAAITATIGAAITVSGTASDRVTIRNLVLIGSGGLDGIRAIEAKDIHVLNCLIRGFTEAGIEIESGRLVVDHSTLVDQSGGNLTSAYGIWGNSDGSHSVNIEVVNSLLDGNDVGLYCSGRTAAVVSSSTISGSAYGGLFTSEDVSGFVPVRGTFENCTFAFNANVFNLDASGTNSSTVYLSQNLIAHNSLVAGLGSGATVFTFGNNRLTENTIIAGPLTPYPFQ